jgi:dGTPase
VESGKFTEVAIYPGHKNWEKCIERPNKLYHRDNDIRSPFARDYNRILHCTAYRRLKHKTQVFFATSNDHICTRIEHVNHVNAVSYTISKHLGLNTELTNAIAIGHDLGHAPFGHAGEIFLKEIVQKETGESFWHEKNSLRFVDKCETLEDPKGYHRNLNLTYAVRDGIISHCGEVDENSIFPRNKAIDLEKIHRPNQYSPYTWEGCVVKIADKIAFIGRDIEDARTLKILSFSQFKELLKVVKPFTKSRLSAITTTAIMHDFIIDLCENSSPKKGISLSESVLGLMNALKNYSEENIYNHWKMENYMEYAGLIVKSIFKMLKKFYKKEGTLEEVKRYSEIYPILTQVFSEWLKKYSYSEERPRKYKNLVLYDMKKESDYKNAIVDFISGMTDTFAIKVFNEIIMF